MHSILSKRFRKMKTTLFLTMSCNINCDYCYIKKQTDKMSIKTLNKALDFIFNKVPENERLDIGLFGGEPLLEWDLAKKAIEDIEIRASKVENDVRISLVTNGTLLNEDILAYLLDHNTILQISCDGTPSVQDKHRRFKNGNSITDTLEHNIKLALNKLPGVLVNSVYSPDTFKHLPESISYLASLGVKQIILNPDYSSHWSNEDIANLKKTYQEIADIYLDYYQKGTPLFISLIDEKIAVILRNGYGLNDRCKMGYGEFAFSSQGNIFPCERLVEDGEKNIHTIGHLDNTDNLKRKHCKTEINFSNVNTCSSCSVSQYCMNWCGCSNFLATGNYQQPSHFICASERMAIELALQIVDQVEEEKKMIFMNHYAGLPMVNSSITV